MNVSTTVKTMIFRYSFSFLTKQRHVLMIKNERIVKYSLNGSMSCNIIKIGMSHQCKFGQNALTHNVIIIYISLG